MVNVGTIGVVGAGRMGAGITEVCILNGFDVILNDRDESSLASAVDAIERSLNRQVRRGCIVAADAGSALARMRATTDKTMLEEVDLAIEAVTEDEVVKRRAYEEVCAQLRPDALLATNTSSISITRLASATDRPEHFIGLHFMNPAPRMQLVEIIRGLATDQATYDSVSEVAHRLGKSVTISEDFPAFIVNRILMPMINEAIYTLYEGVGSVEAIDTSMRLGANHPMGPLQLADFIGLDTCLSIMQALHEGLADPKYRPCPLLVKYVEAGWLGRKSQRGFYDYRGDNPVPSR